MHAVEVWWKKLKNSYFHEKVLIISLLSIFIILVFDCWFQNLPLSGYGIIFITLLCVACTSLLFCHEVGATLSSTVQTIDNEKAKDEKWYFRYFKEKEKSIFRKLFQIDVPALQYPTSFNEQMRLLIKDIERDFVKTWYGDISGNPSFLFDCHLVLEEVIFKIMGKLQNASWNYMLKNTLFLYLSHLQEYKRSVRRSKNCDVTTGAESPKQDIEKIYRYLHPGSESERALNYYLTKVFRILMEEYASHDFVSSLECSIVTSLLARKLLKNLLFNLEDPAWIYIRILYFASHDSYTKLMQGKSYSVKEITNPDPADEIVNKYRMKPAITRKTDIGPSIFDRALSSNVFSTGTSAQKKEKMSLSIPTAKHEPNISSVLGNLISSTAAPLLPDNVSLCYQPLNKMWLSPVAEIKQEITEIVVNPLLKTLSETLKVDEKKGNGLKELIFTKNPLLTRSKSSDAMSPEEDLNPSLTKRDVSVGEELCEGVFAPEEHAKRLVKTKSFDAGSSGDIPGDEKSQGDISPVYEEPEDFATTIAKLRSVLQQRESTSTLSDKSSNSMEGGGFSNQNTFDSIEKLPSSDGGPLSPDSHLACDVPNDGRPFVNVCIPKTEVHESSGSPYVLYTIQYDGIYVKQNGEGDTQLVLQTTVVKRRFQEFVNLQTRLEENPALRSHLKGIKGPSKWLHLPFTAKTDDSTTASRRPILEIFLQQLCTKLEIATSPALQEFLAYGSNGVTAFGSKENNNSPIQKIDKFLSNKVTGVFNSIKTVLPSFEGNSGNNSAAQDAKEVKASFEQNLLQGFLNFGNKSDEVPELVLDYHLSDASGDALTDSIRRFLSEKSECIEDALDVLDSSNWHVETGECHVQLEDHCVWRRFKDAVIDDDLDKFDGNAPIINIILEILSELFDFSEGWVTKEPVVQILKAIAAHWETEFKEYLDKLDWDKICGNLARLLRVTLLSQQSTELAELNCLEVKSELTNVILNLLPGCIGQLIGNDAINHGIKLFVDSISHSLCNRDTLLRFMDLLLSQLLSCPHLSA